MKWHIGPTYLKFARRATNHICSMDARISTCDISIPQRFLQHPNPRQEMLVDRIIIFKAVAERHLDPLFKRRASWIRGAILSLPNRENLLQAEIDPNMISDRKSTRLNSSH